MNLGKLSGLDILNIPPAGILNDLSHLSIPFDKSGLEFGIEADDVMEDKDLTIAETARPDPDGGDGKGFSNLSSQGLWNLLEDNGKTARLLEEMGIFDKPFSRLLIPSLDPIAE